MNKKFALIAMAASSLFAGAAQAIPVEYNGGIFDFNASDCIGLTCTITYTADFTNYEPGNQTNIGGIQWTVSGNTVMTASLVSAKRDSVDAGSWDDAVWGVGLNNSGCGENGGNPGSVCLTSSSYPTATGKWSWVFTATFATALAPNFNETNSGNPIRMWFVGAEGPGKQGNGTGLMSCQTGNANGECGSTSVPEPATLALLGLGLLGIGASRRRRA